MKKAVSVPIPFVPSSRVLDLRLPDRVPGGARQADRDLLAQAPKAYLDTTHFDTLRFPPPEWATSAIDRASRDGSLAYTGYRGHPAVLEGVAARLGDVFGLQFDPSEELMLTPGTQAGLFGALASLIGQGDDVLLVDPDYLFSERILRFLGARVTHIPLTAGASPHPDLNRLEDAFKRVRPKLFVFSHPNNPTGSVYSPDIIAVIAELAVRYDAMVLVDELYARLVYEGTPYVHLATLPGMMDRTITLVGPSKTESLSGYRLGVVGAPAAVIKGIEDIQSITSLRAPAYAQHVLMPWLRDDHEWLVNRLKEFHKLRAMTVHAFEKLPWLTLHIQNATCYAWPDVSALKQSDTAISRALMCEGAMLVSPGYQFGPSGAGHFRVCYARDEAEWAQALERIVCVLDRFALAAGLPGRTA